MIHLVYCDRIADSIQKTINNMDGFEATHPQLDLHPIKGYFLSTKKTISATDGIHKYKITIEEEK